MINQIELEKAIDSGCSFRLGARGICIDFHVNMHNNLWCITVPRAFAEIHADAMCPVDDTNFYSLEVYHKGEMIMDINLAEYDKLTILYGRVTE